MDKLITSRTQRVMRMVNNIIYNESPPQENRCLDDEQQNNTLEPLLVNDDVLVLDIPEVTDYITQVLGIDQQSAIEEAVNGADNDNIGLNENITLLTQTSELQVDHYDVPDATVRNDPEYLPEENVTESEEEVDDIPEDKSEILIVQKKERSRKKRRLVDTNEWEKIYRRKEERRANVILERKKLGNLGSMI